MNEGLQETLQDLDFIVCDIEDVLSELNMSSAVGPEDMQAMLLRKCRAELAVLLYKIWRKSFDKVKVPQAMKYGFISPIHKSDSRGENKLVDFFDNWDQFNISQHGYRKGCSCLSQMLAHQVFLLDRLKKGINVHMVYLNFAKVFDKMDHSVLLHKLSSIEFRGKLGYWIHSFLHTRIQLVAVNDKDIRHSITSFFHDNMRVAQEMRLQEDTHPLQDAINNKFFDENKFEVLLYGSDNTTKECITCSTTQGPIRFKSSLRDLGMK
ncbi:uncharacterized protein LOC143024064 [Oratosquilla oratoria]|uniref:uncharacterized protein LOC143024064 n=1 Tax=Oratosquilla oratoria TaxID=337810 RepID=UPI003F765D33